MFLHLYVCLSAHPQDKSKKFTMNFNEKILGMGYVTSSNRLDFGGEPDDVRLQEF